MVTTRTKSYTYDAATRPPNRLEPTRESLDDRRARWAQLLRSQHYQPIISEVLNGELPKYKNSIIIDAKDRVSHTRECAQVLASAPSVLLSAVEGNLIRRIQTEPSLQQEYATIKKRASEQPSMYIHLLADRDGTPPTPNQYLTIRDFVADYLAQGKDSEHAWQIDQISRPRLTQHESTRGHRKYLRTQVTSRSAKRVETLELFCQGAQKRCNEMPASLRNTSFRYPPGECGYSIDSHIRLAEHRAHRSSNYVMNLVEDICTYLNNVGIFEQHFTMRQFIVYLIFRREQVRISEIFISGLLKVWVEDGGGFNAYPAGYSAATAERISEVVWAMHERETRLNSSINENIRTQQLRMDEYHQALELADASAVDGNMGAGPTDEAECIEQLSQLTIRSRTIKRRI